MKIELKSHQQEIVDMNPERALIPDGTGTGKTLIGISLADNNCKVCLVVTIKDNVEKWKREIHEFSNNNCRYIVISKENFKKMYFDGDFDLQPNPIDGVIVDECHFFAGKPATKKKNKEGELVFNGSQMSLALAKWVQEKNIRYRWLMSATPVTANWLSVFVLANHLGNNLNYYKFMRMFFYEIQMGRRRVWKQNPHKEGELQRIVRRLALGRMVTMEDIVEVPEQKMIVEYFHLTPEQKAAIENLQDPEHIVRFTKQDQIESGTLAGNEYEPAKSFQCLKNFRIWELCQKNTKIAIFARYNHQLNVLKEYLRDLNKPIFIINGENQNRDTTVQAVEKATDCIVLINTATATGYELPSIHVIVFASLSFDFIHLTQAMGRFLRVNRLAPKTYYHLVTKGGVNEAVYDCIKNKESFYIELYKK